MASMEEKVVHLLSKVDTNVLGVKHKITESTRCLDFLRVRYLDEAKENLEYVQQICEQILDLLDEELYGAPEEDQKIISKASFDE